MGFREAIKNAFQFEKDNTHICYLEECYNKEYTPGCIQGKFGFTWYRFVFRNTITNEKMEVLLPDCEIEKIRPNKLIELQDIHEIVIEGDNRMWSFSTKEDVKEEGQRKIEELEEKISGIKRKVKEIKSGE